MKITERNPCGTAKPATRVRPIRARGENCIRRLIEAASAARAGAAQMTLGDWRDLEMEVQRRLQHEI